MTDKKEDTMRRCGYEPYYDVKLGKLFDFDEATPLDCVNFIQDKFVWFNKGEHAWCSAVFDEIRKALKPNFLVIDSFDVALGVKHESAAESAAESTPVDVAGWIPVSVVHRPEAHSIVDVWMVGTLESGERAPHRLAGCWYDDCDFIHGDSILDKVTHWRYPPAAPV